MLVLTRNGDAYPDDANGPARYRLPVGLRPIAGPDGTPQAVLSRGADGGLLHLRLQAAWPDFGPDDRPVAFAAGRFRLLLRTPTSRESGQWWPTPIAGDAVVDRSVSLSPVEALIAKQLGQQAGEMVEVEVELTVRGLAPAYPWLVSVARAALLPRIGALLGTQPASWEAVEAAFLGLTEETFTWYPLQRGALRPPRDGALRAIAHFAAPMLLTCSAAGWTLADTGPDRIDVSLNAPRIDSEPVGLRWSFSDFLAAQADRGRHLIDVAIPAPFAAADLCVVNDLPLAPSGIQSILIEARTGGPTGVVRHEFVPGQPAAARMRFVRETFEDLSIQWRSRSTVMTGTGTAVVATDFRPSGLLIDLNAATLNLNALRFCAASEVFDHVSAIEIGVGNRTIALTRAAPEAWAVGRQPPATATLTAVLASGERRALGTKAIDARGMTIDGAALGVGESTRVVLRPPADLDRKAAYLAVQVEGHPWRTLEAGAELVVTVRREDSLQPARVRYRTRQVARAANGATGVMAESAWHQAAGDAITVDL